MSKQDDMQVSLLAFDMLTLWVGVGRPFVTSSENTRLAA